MAAEAFLVTPKQTKSPSLKLGPGPKMGEDDLQESAVPAKVFHQLFLLPENNQSPNQKTGEEDAMILGKDAHPSSWVAIPPKDRWAHKWEVPPWAFPSELQEPVVFEDLNVYHSQEEFVDLSLAQRPLFSRNHGGENVRDSVLKIDFNENKEDDHQPEDQEFVEHDMLSGYCERYGSQIFKQVKDYEKHLDSLERIRLNSSIPKKKSLRSLLITVENDTPLEDLSEYVDMTILALSQNRRTQRFYTCP
ncbi:zinc finger protein 200-like [Macrotis lagotis]|uniref:zinc finger protein 200-like n=1 Tax=Macrotis lagotis TaxID=92651 RepID=UPI003D68021E